MPVAAGRSRWSASTPGRPAHVRLQEGEVAMKGS
ncbi:hypothetical protein BX265_7092 [Streptomyces sp. TLI_235]|nr:hypothetical protein BX265_8527 [Streptomyces sp. TLI_235]PBC69740.1 hypothetical protein BX265_7092 [Streptomyces sp. TLI_235]